MQEESKKSASEKLSSFLVVLKDIKFLALAAISLAILGFAILSGDGKKIILNSYENLTGHKFESFSSIQDYSSETYIILKDRLSRDTGFKVEDADITVFKESDTLHKYRVALNDEIYFYKVERRTDGTWLISKE